MEFWSTIIFCSFPIFTLNQTFIKDVWENQVLRFFWRVLEAKHDS